MKAVLTLFSQYTHRRINMVPRFLMVISHMLEGKSHATTKKATGKRLDFIVHSFHMLPEV